MLTHHEVQARLADGDVVAPPTGTEEVRLADGVMNFGSGTNISFVMRLYGGLLGRDADTSGLVAWSGGPGSDVDHVVVAQGFLSSAEYQVRHGQQTDAEFVTVTYHDLLFRAPEAEVSVFWQDLLAAGATRAQVLTAIADSAEAQHAWDGVTSTGIFVPDEHAGLIGATYRAAFGREADAGGLVAYSDLFRGGMSGAEFGRQIAGSQEFLVNHGGQTDAEYVQSLYVNALGRAAGEGEVSAWEALLSSGAQDRTQVLLSFVNSDEGRAHLDWVL